MFDVEYDDWIVENGACWASEGTLGRGLHREAVITSMFSGEGFIEYQTKVHGHGKVLLVKAPCMSPRLMSHMQDQT